MKKHIEEYFDRLWPICRSILGEGFRESLNILSEIVPFEKISFKTGEKVHDWTVPQEWMVRDAYILDPTGKKFAQFSENNIHLLNYSISFNGKVSLDELKEHLYTIPNQPDAIPYVTSYYQTRWGFCISHNQYLQLVEGEYKIFIDTEHKNGDLIVGEAYLPGESKKEIFFSSYLCHPSLANNELSGPLVLAHLYQYLSTQKYRKYSCRFVLIPETIGAVAYLSKRGQHLKDNMVAGYQITCIGDAGMFTYKRSRQHDSLADRAAIQMMKEIKNENIISFNPAIGSDERQYCSPGYNLPVGSLMRTMYSMYPEYHTSLDNKSIMTFEGMEEAVLKYAEIVRNIQENYFYVNTEPFGEPQLGPRGLFRSLSGKERQEDELAMWWLLNYADGMNDLLQIAALSGHKMDTLIRVAKILEERNLFTKKYGSDE